MTIGWSSDTKDSALNPTRGVVQRAGFEISPAGDLKYYKATYQHQHYYSVTRNLLLMLNGEVGYAKGIGGAGTAIFQQLPCGWSGVSAWL